VEKPYGWVFIPTTARYLQTGDSGDQFIGVGPLLVRRADGKLLEFSSLYSTDMVLESVKSVSHNVLEVFGVSNRQRIGTIELTDDGELNMTPRGVRGMVERMAKNRGWGAREAFKNLNGWSNGYLQIVPAMPSFDGLEPPAEA
jgi:hypothetical protein